MNVNGTPANRLPVLLAVLPLVHAKIKKWKI